MIESMRHICIQNIVFNSEVNNLDAGLLIEVKNKGVIWDKSLGYHWLHLRDIQNSNVVSCVSQAIYAGRRVTF